MSSDSPVHVATQQATSRSIARIGPNSIIQTISALEEAYGAERTRALLDRGGLARYIEHPPASMVDEQEFSKLVALLAGELGSTAARPVLFRAGQRTAAYLLEHRIPGPFQRLLKLLPRRLALMLLFLAIGKHAWTFVGSGAFTYTVGRTARFEIKNRVAPDVAICGFYQGTFEHLLQVLIDVRGQVRPDMCGTENGVHCMYAIFFR